MTKLHQLEVKTTGQVRAWSEDASQYDAGKSLDFNLKNDDHIRSTEWVSLSSVRARDKELAEKLELIHQEFERGLFDNEHYEIATGLLHGVRQVLEEEK